MISGYMDERTAAALAAAVVKVRTRPVTAGWYPYPHQIAPPLPWKVWALIAGRGSGKTDAGAHYVDAHARGAPCLPGSVPHRMAVLAPTLPDAQMTCVLGDSGLLRADQAIRYRPGSMKEADLVWPNGSQARLFGAHGPDDPNRLRGPQHCLVWADELAAWPRLDETWDMMEFGLRLGPDPRVVVTTTPRSRALLRRLLADPSTVVTRASTRDNPSLPEDRRAALYARYAGTRLGRQELDAEIIDDADGALWTRKMIDYREPAQRMDIRSKVLTRDMARVVVAIDPAVTSGEDSDETGIVGAGIGADARGYVLADASCRMPPADWARRAINLYRELQADRIVAEANNGGDLVSTVIHTIDLTVPVTLVHASRGKRTRAEPVSALYEQGRVSHVVPFPELEDQLCSYTGAPGEDSPDRMDALVWALTDVMNISTDAVWGAGGTWGGSIGAGTA
jgi:predicted phage terminase large subunit-like protein